MIDFIVHYWVEFVFGGIAAFLIAKINRLQTLEKDSAIQEKKDFREQIISEVHDSFTEADTDIKKDIKELHERMEALSKGLLSIQGDKFKRQCRRLLRDDHAILLEEYEQCIADHDAYNGLGGNHGGDLLFESVVEKFEASVQNKKKGNYNV